MAAAISVHQVDQRVPIYQLTKVYANHYQLVMEVKLTTLSSIDRALFSIKGAQVGMQDGFCRELKRGTDAAGRANIPNPDFIKWAHLGGQYRLIVFFSDGVKAGGMIADIRGCR